MIEFTFEKKLNTAGGPITLEVEESISNGSFVCLYGPSGAGKTTILRMLAGLLTPEEGYIRMDNDYWLDINTHLDKPVQRRSVGMVFQDYALFPHMTVKENLKYALARKQSDDIIGELIDMMELGQLRGRKPGTLSGGQQQRVALARALVRKPSLLLLDEPLSALDADMRSKIQDYLLQAHREYGLTTVMVSHDMSEIFKLANYVFMLDHGRVVKQGRPSEVFFGRQISGQFQFTGKVLSIDKEDVLYVLRILIGNDIVKVVASAHEVKSLRAGASVLVVAKAFNPLVLGIE